MMYDGWCDMMRLYDSDETWWKEFFAFFISFIIYFYLLFIICFAKKRDLGD